MTLNFVFFYFLPYAKVFFIEFSSYCFWFHPLVRFLVSLRINFFGRKCFIVVCLLRLARATVGIRAYSVKRSLIPIEIAADTVVMKLANSLSESSLLSYKLLTAFFLLNFLSMDNSISGYFSHICQPPSQKLLFLTLHLYYLSKNEIIERLYRSLLLKLLANINSIFVCFSSRQW